MVKKKKTPPLPTLVQLGIQSPQYLHGDNHESSAELITHSLPKALKVRDGFTKQGYNTRITLHKNPTDNKTKVNIVWKSLKKDDRPLKEFSRIDKNLPFQYISEGYATGRERNQLYMWRFKQGDIPIEVIQNLARKNYWMVVIDGVTSYAGTKAGMCKKFPQVLSYSY